MKLLDGVTADAVLSPCGKYRYALTRRWMSVHEHGGDVVWVMLNPSTATAETDDQTIRKCIGFSKRWGFDGLTVVNLFALRSRDPKELYRHPDPIGEVNDTLIETCATSAYTGLVVGAWGAHGALHNRGLLVTGMLTKLGVTLQRIGPATKGGHPGHPLLLAYDTPREVHK